MVKSTASTGNNRRPKHPQDVILDLIRDITREVHPHHPPEQPISLDSSLDRDLGLDSLSRIELISRLETAFKVAVPERFLTQIETPRDILRVVDTLDSAPNKTTTVEPVKALEAVGDLPDQAQTLIDVLEWHAQHHPDRTTITVLGDEDAETTLTYTDLYQNARRVAAGLQSRGMQVGDTVALMLPTCAEYFYIFYGILLAGGVPVPIYPPMRMSQLEDHLVRQKNILSSCQAAFLVTFPEAKAVAGLLKSQLPALNNVLETQPLILDDASYQRPVIGSNHIAFLQYTSGSTGQPKGVILSHGNLLTNIRIMGKVVDAGSKDVFVSWLPLYHDMGLIGAWLGTMYHSALLVIMSPLAFLNKPHRWLWNMHRYRATLSAAPNFAYEFCVKRLQDNQLEGLDLSHWRIVFNGAEPISTQTMHRFLDRFAPYGLKPQAMCPVYGLAENTLGLSFSPVDRAPKVDYVDREELMQNGRARPVDPSHSHALSFVSCGQPLPEHEIRIVDESGQENAERIQGHIQFKGPSATSGYFRNAKATQALFDGPWLNTGDMGYFANGELYITGRSKDLIIRHGRNIFPEEMEQAVGEIDGIRKGCVALFAARNAKTAVEKLVVIAEIRQHDEQRLQALRSEIRGVVTRLCQIPPDDIVLAPPHSVLKTSSGKIRRAACRELYEQGKIGSRQAVWLQVLRLATASVAPVLKKWRQMTWATAFNAYAYAWVCLLILPAWLGTIVLPTVNLRWRWLRRLLSVLKFAVGVKTRKHHLAALPHEPVIYVVNHASYVDVLAVLDALKTPARFVSKRELASHLLLGPLLYRLKVHFVERFHHEKSSVDARLLRKGIQDGQSLIMFPEGTFTRVPGLLPFHMGAFMTAVETETPVVPIILRGTRNIMRANSWFLRRSHVTITVGKAIYPQTYLKNHATPWAAAVSLRDETRSVMLRHCGEPDLAHEKHAVAKLRQKPPVD